MKRSETSLNVTSNWSISDINTLDIEYNNTLAKLINQAIDRYKHRWGFYPLNTDAFIQSVERYAYSRYIVSIPINKSGVL